MDITIIATIFVIGFVGSFISGMLGIGGVIINYPMLLYIPVMLGVGHFTAHEVSGITAIQVFFATLGGVLAYRKDGFLNKTLIIYMGVSIVTGSFIGGLSSTHMPETGINIVYGILALIAVIMVVFYKTYRCWSFWACRFNWTYWYQWNCASWLCRSYCSYRLCWNPILVR